MPLQTDRPTLGADGSIRKAHYGDGKQPWDTIKELSWAPEFAAGNVIKNLRRSKDPEHSLQSARWYYRELRHMVHRDNHPSVGYAARVTEVLKALMGELTDAELILLTKEDVA